MTRGAFAWSVLVVALVGCTEPDMVLKEPAAQTAPNERAGDDDSYHASLPLGDAQRRAEAEQPNRTEAQAGVTGKGNYGPGIVTTPISAYFRVTERLAFQRVEKGVRDHKAIHDTLPQTTEAFMREIVEFNGIQLPELPDGHRYVWDPQQEQLLVEHPSR